MDIFTERIELKRRVVVVMLLLSYFAVILPFTAYLKNRPTVIKLGYLPEAVIIRAVSGDQRYLIAESTIVKVLFYYGSLIDKLNDKVIIPPEYQNMFRTLETAVKLDPYNKDPYYFAQAAFTWEVGHAADVNKMLMYGMKYRTWDSELPFYISFNNAYFMKDFRNAAIFMKNAAEISGFPLYTSLAARYFYEAGIDELGIVFLDTMEKGAQDKQIKKIYQLRKQALISVKTLREAMKKFKASYRRMPTDLSELVASGTLKEIPTDPYGGRFYLAKGGMIRSTSKFTLEGGSK